MIKNIKIIVDEEQYNKFVKYKDKEKAKNWVEFINILIKKVYEEKGNKTCECGTDISNLAKPNLARHLIGNKHKLGLIKKQEVNNRN